MSTFPQNLRYAFRVDPTTLTAASFFFFASTLFAAYLGARSAMRVEPLIGLHYE